MVVGQHYRAVVRLYLPQRAFQCLRCAVPLPDSVAIKGVVVYAPYIAREVLPSIVPDDWAGGIERFGEVVDAADVVLLRRVALE